MLSIINLYLFIPINAIIFPLILKKKKNSNLNQSILSRTLLLTIILNLNPNALHEVN